jgi:hypothetical protein
LAVLVALLWELAVRLRPLLAVLLLDPVALLRRRLILIRAVTTRTIAATSVWRMAA